MKIHQCNSEMQHCIWRYIAISYHWNHARVKSSIDMTMVAFWLKMASIGDMPNKEESMFSILNPLSPHQRFYLLQLINITILVFLQAVLQIFSFNSYINWSRPEFFPFPTWQPLNEYMMYTFSCIVVQVNDTLKVIYCSPSRKLKTCGKVSVWHEIRRKSKKFHLKHWE